MAEQLLLSADDLSCWYCHESGSDLWEQAS